MCPSVGGASKRFPSGNTLFLCRENCQVGVNTFHSDGKGLKRK